jgi:hypothetical protein
MATLLQEPGIILVQPDGLAIDVHPGVCNQRFRYEGLFQSEATPRGSKVLPVQAIGFYLKPLPIQ